MISVLRPWPFVIHVDDLFISIDPYNPFSDRSMYKVIVEHKVTRMGIYLTVSEQLMEDEMAFGLVIDDAIDKVLHG